jgi:hypothetical protein
MKIRLVLLYIFFISFLSVSQESSSFWNKIPRYKFDVSKYGPYLGLQRGKYNNVEFGFEYQWKKIQLIKPYIHSFHGGFNYNLYNNVLGYELGYWFKQGRLNLTYGANLVYRTNYSLNAVGFTPVIGFKFSQLHLQTGYNFLSKDSKLISSNDFFVSLRFVFIQNRDFDIEKIN